MTKKTEVSVIDFNKFDITQLPELQGKKEEIKSVIDANPIVKVTDNTSYELAKKSRTAVKTLRTSLEKEKKEVNDRIKKNVLEVVANEYDSLITDVKNDENARQEEVTAWETKKEEERLEKLRLEQERIDGIKKRIGEFRQNWEDLISHLLFEGITNCQQNFDNMVKDFDRQSLQEFEVLFDDYVKYLTELLNSRIKTLTEQEEIRITQIELAKEKERQRLEAEKIAEAQRIQREKFEAEQKAIAEKQRIAQEKFQKEKAEFEAKQAEAKFQERCKELAELGFVLNERNEAYQKGLHYLNLEDIKLASDDLWIKELEDAKNAKDFSEMETQEVEFEEAKIDESANSETTLKLESLDNELTWNSIYSLFQDQTITKKDLSVKDFYNWLSENYNVPTLKNK